MPKVFDICINIHQQIKDMDAQPKFMLTEGKHYRIVNKKFAPCAGMISGDMTAEFIKSYPCFDARFHGTANAQDYVAYKFKLPGLFGTVTFFEYQIISVEEIKQ